MAPALIRTAGWIGLILCAGTAAAQSAIEDDWLYQAEGAPLLERAADEVGWAEDMAVRMTGAKGGTKSQNVETELAALRQLKAALQAAVAFTEKDEGKLTELYLSVRRLKRAIMLQHAEIDFDRLLFVDIPYPQGANWMHESRYHSAMCAVRGGRLLVLDGLSPDGAVTELMPREDGPAAFFRPDLSYDAKRVLFCMMPEKDKSYHLYEIGIDGRHLRQITHGDYSDMDPVYLPDGNCMFVSTRGNVYAQCAPWAPQHVLTRCDRDGKNIYILDAGSEPDYTPAVLEDGQVLYTRWEYIDKPVMRIEKLWTTHPDGTAQNIVWGNQSMIPDHMGEGRPIPGTGKIMFTGMGHHAVFDGSIGIVDPSQGRNYPLGLSRVTMDMYWAESGSPRGEIPAAADYHASGRFEAYKCPFPLSEELFLVSARRTGDLAPENRQAAGGSKERLAYRASIPQRCYRLYLMDLHGNRELLYEGSHNVLYAQPVRARKTPPILADAADWPGSEKDHPLVRPGTMICADVFAGARQESELRKRAKYLRVIEALPKTYSTGGLMTGGGLFGSGDNTAFGRDQHPAKPNDGQGDGGVMQGPATTVIMALAIKRILGTVPIAADGSVHFEVPPARSVYFHLLDEDYRLLQAMRSWTSVRPGERRACVGCHETRNWSPTAADAYREKSAQKLGQAPDQLTPPPWGARSLSYVKDIQPIFDRHCAQCHQGHGEAVAQFDLTLRPSTRQGPRWTKVFAEPYLTLLIGPEDVPESFKGGIGALLPRQGLAGVFLPDAAYGLLEPMTSLSYTSRLINMLRGGNHYHVQLPSRDMQMLMAWIDTWGMYRSEGDVRELEDPDPAKFADWPYPPRLANAPVVRKEYSQDEYGTQEDRLPPPTEAQQR